MERVTVVCLNAALPICVKLVVQCLFSPLGHCLSCLFLTLLVSIRFQASPVFVYSPLMTLIRISASG